MKKLIITTASILALLTGGTAVVVSQQGNKPVETKEATVSVQQPTKPSDVPEAKELEVESTPMVPEPVAPPTPEPQPEPTPGQPAPVVVKSFGELILNYPRMTDTPLKVECLNRIAAGWPERFQDHNREANVDLLGKRLLNPCAQLYKGLTLLSVRPFPLMEDFGQGDWFVRNGAQ